MKADNKEIIIFSVLLGLIVSLLAGSYFFSRWIHQPLPLQHKKRLVIESGMTGREVGRLLKKHNVIDSVESFRWAIWLQGVERDLRLGTVVLAPPMTRYQLMEKLRQKNPELIRVQIKEGWPSWRIFDELATKLDLEKEKFENLSTNKEFLADQGISAGSAEGYLYPETYYISLDASPREIISRLINHFHKVSGRLNLRQKAEKNGMNMHKVVTLASIIEREVRVPKEYEVVSSVYHNRLQRGMKLQADPTVLYAVGDFDGSITHSELNVSSPYNTYLYSGLPPGPICSPSGKSLKAAVNPADTEYLYFVSRADGTHLFSETYSNHQEAVRKYQR
ncbi:MAG: endolytic transglycosylase MltG [bacterium]